MNRQADDGLACLSIALLLALGGAVGTPSPRCGCAARASLSAAARSDAGAPRSASIASCGSTSCSARRCEGGSSRRRPREAGRGSLAAGEVDRQVAPGSYRATLRGRASIVRVPLRGVGHLFMGADRAADEGGEVVGGMAVSRTSPISAGPSGSCRAGGRRKLILDAMNEAYVATDGQGLVKAWNRAAERTFGWSTRRGARRAAAGADHPPEDRADFDALLARTLPGIPDARPRRRHGSSASAVAHGRIAFPVELALTLVEVEGETELHTLMHDISERKEAERDAARACDRRRGARRRGRRARPQHRLQRGAGRGLPCGCAHRRGRRRGADRARLLRHRPARPRPRRASTSSASSSTSPRAPGRSSASARASRISSPTWRPAKRSGRRCFRDHGLVSVLWVPVVQDDDGDRGHRGRLAASRSRRSRRGSSGCSA